MTTPSLLDACQKLPDAPPLYAPKRKKDEDDITFRPGRGLASVQSAIAEVGDDPNAVAVALGAELGSFEESLFDDGTSPMPLEPLFDFARALATSGPKDHVTRAELRIEEGALVLVEGDLTVAGDCIVHGTLVVTGDLTVAGTLAGFGEEWFSGALVVLGDARAERMVSLGPAAVGGRLAVTTALYAEHYDDACATLFAKALSTPALVVAGGCDFVRAQTRDVGVHVQNDDDRLARKLPQWFEDGGRTFDLDEIPAAFFDDLRALATSRTKRK